MRFYNPIHLKECETHENTKSVFQAEKKNLVVPNHPGFAIWILNSLSLSHLIPLLPNSSSSILHPTCLKDTRRTTTILRTSLTTRRRSLGYGTHKERLGKDSIKPFDAWNPSSIQCVATRVMYSAECVSSKASLPIRKISRGKPLWFLLLGLFLKS